MPFLTTYWTGELAKKFSGQFYAAAFVVEPSVNSPGVEVSGSAYKREPVIIEADAERATNAAEIAFEIASGEWGSVIAIGICDALKGGHLCWWSPNEPEAIGLNHQLRVPKGRLQLRLNK